MARPYRARNRWEHLFRAGGEQDVVGGLDDVVLCVRVLSLRLVREYLAQRHMRSSHRIEVAIVSQFQSTPHPSNPSTGRTGGVIMCGSTVSTATGWVCFGLLSWAICTPSFSVSSSSSSSQPPRHASHARATITSRRHQASLRRPPDYAAHRVLGCSSSD